MPRNKNFSPRALGRAQASLSRLAQPPAPPRPKLRKRKRPWMLRTTVMRVIPGTRGLWAALARRLGCCMDTVQRALRQEGWENVLEAFEQERLVARDGCVETIYNIARWSPSDDSRLSAAKFILEKTHPDFRPVSKHIVEGGDKPIQHQHVTFNVPPEILNASVADRIQLLEMLDEVEENSANS